MTTCRSDDKRLIVRRCPVAAKQVIREMNRTGITHRQLAEALGVTRQAIGVRLKGGVTPEMRDRYMAAIEAINS